MPSRAKSQAVPVDARDEASFEGGLVARRALLQAFERDLFRGGDALHLVEEVVDGAVTRRRHANALPGRKQRDDQPSAGPRLAASGRSLDDEIALVEIQDQSLLCGEVERLNAAGSIRREPRQVASKDIFDRSIARPV